MATCSGQLNDDLVLQIFTLLPLKSLARFKSVSRQWRSLISNDPRPVRALLLDDEKDMHLVPLDTNTNTCHHQSFFPFHKPRLVLLQSCNGLLLFRTAATNATKYHVHNPLTGQHATLPELFSVEHQVTACLAYDPSNSPYYKLLCLCPFQIIIYSSRTSHWTRWDASSFEPGLEHINIVHYSPCTTHGLSWNGSVYYTSNIAREHTYKLYRFDLFRQTMVEAPLPRDDDFKTSCLKRLVLSWGRLYILGVADAVGQELRVYEMERDHSAWRLKHRLDDFGRDLKLRFRRSGNGLKIRLGGRKIFRVWRDNYQVFFPAPEMGGEDEIWLVVTGDVSLVYRYGLESKSVVSVSALKSRQHRRPRCLRAHEFAESMSVLPQPRHHSYIYDFA